MKLADIITIRPGSGAGTDNQSASHSKFSHGNIELLPVGAPTSFSIYHVSRASGHKLRQSHIVFHANDAGVVTQWVDRVNDILAWPGRVLTAWSACNKSTSSRGVTHNALYKSVLLTLLTFITSESLLCYLRYFTFSLLWWPSDGIRAHLVHTHKPFVVVNIH